uniref:MADF domain-containing protein n=1 Tax=Musca domestica TaxID=7370 RepID=A0A1I8NJA0_MUSDO
MRTCYRQELKTYIQSDRSGAGADDLYVPKLWYFELFSFLRDLEIPLSGRSNFSSEEDEEPTCNSNKKHQQNKYTPKKSCAVDLRTAFLKKASEHLDLSVNK